MTAFLEIIIAPRLMELHSPTLAPSTGTDGVRDTLIYYISMVIITGENSGNFFQGVGDQFLLERGWEGSDFPPLLDLSLIHTVHTLENESRLPLCLGKGGGGGGGVNGPLKTTCHSGEYYSLTFAMISCPSQLDIYQSLQPPIP